MTTIRASVRPNGDVVSFRFGKKLEAAQGVVETAILREAIKLVAYIKERKLSDQILQVQTGRLRRSITYRTEGSGTGEFRAFVGTNVKYARAHEYGFSGPVQVRAHIVKEHQRKMTEAFGRPMKNPRAVTVREHTVKQHSMNMNLPPRPFLRTSLEENRESIMSNLRKTLAEALAG